MTPSTQAPAPLLIEHPRSADAIAAVLQRRLERAGFGTAAEDPLRAALVRVAARHAEILTSCINAAADLHLGVFGEFLAGPRRPAAAAQVHLVFTAAPGVAPVVVPMHTRVAATAREGDTEPVIFETCEDLELVRADCLQAWFVDAGHRHVLDVGSMLTAGGLTELPPLAAALAVVYGCHFAWHDAGGVAGLRELRLQIVVDAQAAPGSGWQVEWALVTPQGELPLLVRSDGSGQLTRDGDVVLQLPPAWPLASVAGIESRWLTARLRPPPLAADNTDTTSRPPRLRLLRANVSAATAPAPLQAACHGALPLDVSKDFFPFGERPRFGEVAYLLSPAFTEVGAHVELNVEMTNPQNATAPPIPAVSVSGKPVVVWEISTGNRSGGWKRLAVSDGTHALTDHGLLTFNVPAEVAPTTIAGVSGVWLRAVLVSGDYGTAHGTPTGIGTSGAEPPRTPKAPALHAVTVQSLLQRGPLPPDRIVTEGALVSSALVGAADLPFDLALAPDVDGPALYLALGVTGAVSPPPLAAGRLLSLHVRPAAADPPVVLDCSRDHRHSLSPRWEGYSSGGWTELAVRDGSEGLTRPGIIQLHLPRAAARWAGSALDAGGQCAWLRAVWPATGGARSAIPLGLALNGVLARHTQQFRDEVVGSSNGRSGQSFKILRRPVIGAALLQVREAGDAWQPWEEVDSLGTSSASERHYTLDRHIGELRFGDGRHGRIPPAGANNVRLHRYAAGGGLVGNRPAFSVTQLRAAVPAVEKVTNLEPATGGLDAQDEADRHARAAAWLGHRDRAVCADDYAELAMQASPEVARAWCVPGRDLATPTSTVGAAELQPGVFSVVVMPQSDTQRPQPTLALLALVSDHLDTRRPPAGRLVLVGPRYAAVAVKVEISVEPASSPHNVAAVCRRRIERFLHPLTGGTDGRGWSPGKRPHRSDLVALAGAVDGVDVVRHASLHVDADEARTSIVAAGAVVVVAEAV